VFAKAIERFKVGQTGAKETVRHRAQFVSEGVFLEAVEEDRVNSATHAFRTQNLIPGAEPFQKLVRLRVLELNTF
jgi:hypothetical protein